MQKLQLFLQEERQGIESKFGGERLFEWLRGAFQRLMNQSEAIGLHPSEAYYHVMCTVDYLRGMEHRRSSLYCHNELTGDLVGYFKEHTPTIGRQDMQMAVGTIMQGSAEVLLRSGMPEWVDVSGAVKLQVERFASDLVPTFDLEFSRGFRYDTDDDVAAYISGYLTGQRVISEEIDALLEGLDCEEPWQTKARRAGWAPMEEESEKYVLRDSQSEYALPYGRKGITLPAVQGNLNVYVNSERVSQNTTETKEKALDKPVEDKNNEEKRTLILEYVNRLYEEVEMPWRNKYNTLWERIIELGSVSQTVYAQGKQQGTTFNRNLVGNIIHCLADKGIYKEVRAQRLAEILEGKKNHSVRASLGYTPPKDIQDELDALLKSL